MIKRGDACSAFMDGVSSVRNKVNSCKFQNIKHIFKLINFGVNVCFALYQKVIDHFPVTACKCFIHAFVIYFYS